MTATVDAPTRNIALIAARVVAGLLGAIQLAGAIFFMLIAPEQAVWVGPWLDLPIVTIMLGGFLCKLAVALLPGLGVDRRITLGLVAVAIGVAVTLVKIPVYDEPEGLAFLAFDGLLLLLLLVARRTR
jgi:hypothetical protein